MPITVYCVYHPSRHTPRAQPIGARGRGECLRFHWSKLNMKFYALQQSRIALSVCVADVVDREGFIHYSPHFSTETSANVVLVIDRLPRELVLAFLVQAVITSHNFPSRTSSHFFLVGVHGSLLVAQRHFICPLTSQVVKDRQTLTSARYFTGVYF